MRRIAQAVDRIWPCEVIAATTDSDTHLNREKTVTHLIAFQRTVKANQVGILCTLSGKAVSHVSLAN